MTIESIKKILQKLAISYKEILPVQSGYRNKNFPIKLENNEIVNLIVYKDEPDILNRIKRINLLSNFLYRKKLPVRTIKNDRPEQIISIKTKETTRYACIYNYLTGSTIEWEHYTRKHIKLLGWAMAKMHEEMGNYDSVITNLESKNRFPKFSEEMYEQIIDMQKYFSNEGVIQAMKAKLHIIINNKIFEKFLRLQQKLEKQNSQILHLDFVRGNILFAENAKPKNLFQIDNLTLSGIIDLEKAATGPIIVDIARTLAFLITDCSKYSKTKIIKYFIDSGYVKRGQSKIPSFQLLQPLMQYFWFFDFYKFLKHNPYESLGENYHFVRTLEEMGNKL